MCSLGLMVEDMRVNMLMIRKKVKVYFIGPMAENMKADGKTVNSTELVHTHQRQVKQNKVNGKMEKDYIG